MAELWELIPDVDVLLALSPEDLAGPLLIALNSRTQREQRLSYGRRVALHLGNFILELSGQHTRYPDAPAQAVMDAVQEAWAWLVGQALLAPDGLVHPAGSYFVTRRGRALNDMAAFKGFRTTAQLPRDLLDPRLRDGAWLSFARGDWSTAVFQAFRDVEVAVREAAELTNADYGDKLMRKAFNPEGGPLTAPEQEPAERKGLADMFAGAIGSYKNPHSHRRVSIEAADAVEMIMLASHLLRIVDARRPTRPATPEIR